MEVNTDLNSQLNSSFPKLSDPVLIKSISTDTVRVLLEPYHVSLPEYKLSFTIPKGYVTDGHSYSFFDICLENFYGGRLNDKYIVSSLVHDYLYTESEGVSRYDADTIYYKLRNKEYKRPVLHTWCYIGIRMGGWLFYQRSGLGDEVYDETLDLHYLERVDKEYFYMDTLDIVMLSLFGAGVLLLILYSLYRFYKRRKVQK
jgi:hypothetical protein